MKTLSIDFDPVKDRSPDKASSDVTMLRPTQQRPIADVTFGDDLDGQEILRKLKELHCPCKLITPVHIKIGSINFYLPKGKIFIDGQTKYPGSGWNALVALLRSQRIIE
jgi:hypothetical protein